MPPPRAARRAAFYAAVFAASVCFVALRQRYEIRGAAPIAVGVVAAFVLAGLFRGLVQPTPQQAAQRERAGQAQRRQRAKPKRA